MATSTVERPQTRKLSSASARPDERLGVGEDGFPTKIWDVNGEPVAFSLRPFTEAERKVYWNPQGPDAPMWWRAQDINEHGYQPIIQRECWLAARFSPRNAWEEHMTIEWLKTVSGGSNGHNWVGYDHPKNGPGEPLHHWICGTCGTAYGPYAAFEQHQLMNPCNGMKKSE